MAIKSGTTFSKSIDDKTKLNVSNTGTNKWEAYAFFQASSVDYTNSTVTGQSFTPANTFNSGKTINFEICPVSGEQDTYVLKAIIDFKEDFVKMLPSEESQTVSFTPTIKILETQSVGTPSITGTFSVTRAGSEPTQTEYTLYVPMYYIGNGNYINVLNVYENGKKVTNNLSDYENNTQNYTLSYGSEISITMQENLEHTHYNSYSAINKTNSSYNQNNLLLSKDKTFVMPASNVNISTGNMIADTNYCLIYNGSGDLSLKVGSKIVDKLETADVATGESIDISIDGSKICAGFKASQKKLISIDNYGYEEDEITITGATITPTENAIILPLETPQKIGIISITNSNYDRKIFTDEEVTSLYTLNANNADALPYIYSLGFLKVENLEDIYGVSEIKETFDESIFLTQDVLNGVDMDDTTFTILFSTYDVDSIKFSYYDYDDSDYFTIDTINIDPNASLILGGDISAKVLYCEDKDTHKPSIISFTNRTKRMLYLDISITDLDGIITVYRIFFKYGNMYLSPSLGFGVNILGIDDISTYYNLKINDNLVENGGYIYEKGGNALFFTQNVSSVDEIRNIEFTITCEENINHTDDVLNNRNAVGDVLFSMFCAAEKYITGDTIFADDIKMLDFFDTPSTIFSFDDEKTTVADNNNLDVINIINNNGIFNVPLSNLYDIQNDFITVTSTDYVFSNGSANLHVNLGSMKQSGDDSITIFYNFNESENNVIVFVFSLYGRSIVYLFRLNGTITNDIKITPSEPIDTQIRCIYSNSNNPEGDDVLDYII